MYLCRIISLLIVLLGTPLFAQDSLGDGRGLEANSSLGGPVNLQENLPTGVRNHAIRTSSVLHGRDFNEGIGRGYDDAAGLRLLSDAANEGTEAYQDALNNSPWYWNNWSSQSAQFLSQGELDYFNPTFVDNWATAPKQMSIGRKILSYSHAWNEGDAKKYGGEGELESSDVWSKRHEDQYKLGQVLGNGKMPDALDTSPIPVGIYQTADSSGYIAASSMAGVSIEKTDQPTSALGFSAWDEARIAEDSENGIGSNQLVQSWRVTENRFEQQPANSQIDISDQYNQMLQTVALRAQDEIVDSSTDSTKSLSWLDGQYFQLQNDLVGIPYLGDEEDDDIPITDTTSESEELDDGALEIISATLRHGEKLTHLSGQHQTRFDELIYIGETALANGNYFDAQRRFNQALQFVPGHPLATAGLGHAKIGAGLYLSAGYVLQSLMSFQPEMIDVEYGATLLPPRIELVRAAVTVASRLDIERDAGTYAFLLAYIGHQLHDEEMVEQGLRTLQLYVDSKDPIIPLLKSIWLTPETPVVTPEEPTSKTE